MEAMSLFELNNMVREVLEMNFDNYYWVRAELSEVRVSQKGHCFIELVDKEETGSAITAKARGVIMRNVYPLLRLNFEEVTGQVFTAGLRVLMQVSVSFSEQYGYSLIVHDIDANYTIGSVAQRRKEIMLRLEKEGVANMNKELPLPPLIQRIAVISSPTAAGYEDFCNQLDHHPSHFRFCHQLFPATMQGEETERSVIAALETIAEDLDAWDAVVIIRGGGAVSDLTSFDTYPLANNCAQFPLPILTGIGHERDICVLDMVAHAHFKTPTAVAGFLIDEMQKQADALEDMENRLLCLMDETLTREKERMQSLLHRLELICHTYVPNHIHLLDRLYERISSMITQKIQLQHSRLESAAVLLKSMSDQKIAKEQQHIHLLESVLKAYDPQNVLKMGYSITMKDGKVVKDASQLKPGDELVTQLKEGEVKSRVV